MLYQMLGLWKFREAIPQQMWRSDFKYSHIYEISDCSSIHKAGVPTFQRNILTSLSYQPAVPGNTLETDLRRKYLTQVDILPQDEGYFKVIYVCMC